MIARMTLLLITTLVIAGCGDFEWFPDGTKPNAFSFTATSGVNRRTPIVSNTITVSGNSYAAPISISNGEYSIDDGDYTSASGKVSAGQTVTVRHISAIPYDTTTTTTLTIGGVSATFSSTTMSAPTGSSTITPFTFAPRLDVAVKTAITSDGIIIQGFSSAVPISVTNGEYSLDGGTFTSTAGTINPGQTVALRHTSSDKNHALVTTTLTVGPSGASASGTFTSMTKAAAGGSGGYGNYSTVTGGVTTDPTGQITVNSLWSTVNNRTSTAVSFSVNYSVTSTSQTDKFIGITVAGVSAQNQRIFSGLIDTTASAVATTTGAQSFGSALSPTEFDKITHWVATKIVIY